MPCALLGDRASGKTTFLGLLYSAQVKYGTGVQDDFRFHAPIGSLNLMSAVYEGMKDGRFPSATLKEEITELGFIFGYLRKVVGKLPYYIRQQNWARPFSTLRFSAYDVSGEDIEEFIETGIASRPTRRESTPPLSSPSSTPSRTTFSLDWASIADSPRTSAHERTTQRPCSESSSRKPCPRSVAARLPASAWTRPRTS